MPEDVPGPDPRRPEGPGATAAEDGGPARTGAAPRDASTPSLARADVARDPAYATGRVFARMWRDHLRADVWPISGAALLLAAEGAAMGFAARMLEPLFDRVLVGGQSSAIPVIALVIMAIFGVRAVSGLASTVILSAVATRGILGVQRRMTAHVMTLDAANLAGVPPGALIERVQGDANRLRGIWNGLITNVFRDAVALVALTAAAISIDPLWTLAALVGVPLLMLPAVVVQRYVKRKAGTVQALAAERATRLDEIFHGLRPIRLNAMEGYQIRRFEGVAGRLRRAQVRAAGAEGTLPALVDVATGLGFVGVLVLGGGQVAAGDKTVGEFMAFFAAMTLAFQPLRKLAGTSAKIQTAGASLARIYRLLDERPRIPAPAAPLALPPGPPEIVFEGVRVEHAGQPALRGASFTAAAGEVTALVGASGAGKSTCFDALTRLVPLAGGRILVGGVPLERVAAADLYAAVGVVSQDALLFDDSLRENVTLGREVPEDRIIAALEAAGVTEFLGRLPRGLASPAGVRGSNLSGGQRQRVAIARALVRDAPVLLLDEATSALDARSEALVQDALDRAAEGRTTLVIAHRLSTVRNADKIVVLDAGRVAEEGTHDALLARGGAYAALHALAAS